MKNYEDKKKQLRLDIINMLQESKSGHPGGSLSIVEMLIAIYYEKMNIDPKNPSKEDRDRFILSKGHACPALYAVLADLGYFPKEDLKGFRKFDSHLQGHPDMHKTPGIDMNTGSLGQGISLATGFALAGKHSKKDYKVYTIIGDGECQEGLVWEAAMAAAHYKLDNLIVLLDNNRLQIDGAVKDVMNIEDVSKKFEAFGFQCYQVDGHNIEEIVSAINSPVVNKPMFIKCNTVKGKGVSFMEDNSGWHGKPLSDEDYALAVKELEV